MHRLLAITAALLTLVSVSVVLAATSQPLTIHGRVVNAKGPVAGARVRFQGERVMALTDRAGSFHLLESRKSSRITAWKKGYTIAGAPANRLPLELKLLPLPETDFEGYTWVDPAPDARHANNCGNCHQHIYREWQDSAHARSATNRRLLNLFGGTDWHGRPSPEWNLKKEHPLGAGVCAVCHAPTYRDPDLDYDLTRVTGVAARGIHCDFCHKVVDAPTDHLGTTFGKDGYELLRPRDGKQLFFGPLEDAFREGEYFGYAPLYTESRYCASCHEGLIFGVPVYGTYSEWLKSPARARGVQCQDCHMSPTSSLTNIAPGRGGIDRNPKTLASHQLVGGTSEMLRKCLQIEVQLSRNKDRGLVEVQVRAQSVGHQVPTGFIDRNVLLVVEAFGRDGHPVALVDGPKLPAAAGKRLTGMPGFLYAKLLRGRDGRAPIPFWLPHRDMIDTRLAPDATDRKHFVFEPRIEHVRVRLLYRRFWQDLAESKCWPENEIIVSERVVRPTSPPP